MFATQETMRTTFVPATSHARPASVTAKEEWFDCHAPIRAVLAALGFRLAGNHDDVWQYYVAAIGDGPRTIYRVASLADQSQIDRAHESVTTAHPDADAAEYDALIAVAIADIVAIDAAADAAERAGET